MKRRSSTGAVKLGAVVSLLYISGCAAPLPDSLSDLELTWSEATVVLPSGDGEKPLFTKFGGDLPTTRGEFPTVLYLHGCTGLRDHEFLARLARAGFAVIAPDSFARRYRPRQCDPNRKAGGYNLFVYDFRLAEISYALHRMPELGWVDERNLFLVGTSEGGVAAALYRGDEFSARVIAQWTCNGAPIVRGIGAPAAEPILAIVYANDPWYAVERTSGQTGHCGEFIAERPASRSIVLRGKQGHTVFDEPSNIEAVLDFLGRQRRP